MNEELIAPCGMNCGVCASYLAMKNDLKKRGIGKTYCAGCLPGGKNCHYKKQCDLLGKGLVRFCYECGDFPCRRLKTLDKRYRTFYHMSMIENLEYIKDNGISRFLEREQEKWRCPECGEVICCHNGICFNCSLDKLRPKEAQISLGGEIMKKTWQEKLKDKPSFPKVLKLETRFPCYNAVHKMGAEVGDDVVLVNPSEVVAVMKQVPKGKLITIVEICKQIARNHSVEACCSLTTGIFIMTAANATEEASKEGKSLDIPYWRTLKADGFLNEKYPGGQEAHKRLLEGENFRVIARGKKYRVVDYEKYLMELT